MKFNINSRIFEKFSGLNIGVVLAQGINNKGTDKEVVALLRAQEKEIKSKFNTETLSQNPKINAWRQAYSSFGAKPKKYRCSVENLYRMILSGVELKHINRLVDVYNYISIKHLIPVGGDDIDKVEGGITLTLAEGSESFIELNSNEADSPKPGEVVYVDDKEVLCRRWNWRECDKSKMTETTKNATLVVEGIPPVTKQEVEVIIAELASLIKKYCGGDVKSFVLNEKNPEGHL